MSTAYPIAILISDIHLSLKCPRARSPEPDWLEAQARPLRELSHQANELGVPIFCAGDIFDRWDAPAELINYAIEHMPPMFAVAGNHDLPYHDIGQIHRSAFWTLVQAGKLTCLGSHPTMIKTRDRKSCGYAYGAHYGQDYPDLSVERSGTKGVKLAVVHAYCWNAKVSATGYPGAPVTKSVHHHIVRLKGFDVAVFGDNHKSFEFHGGPTVPLVYNHGALIRRTQDERNQNPEYGLLMSDGTVERHPLGRASDDLFAEPDDNETGRDMSELTALVTELEQSADVRFDFRAAVRRYVSENKPSQRVRELLTAMMEPGKR